MKVEPEPSRIVSSQIADWSRRVVSLRIRIHAARERAGLCDPCLCVWWYL